MLRLLRGGRSGIDEWNRRREAGEAIPNLREADLAEAGLSRVDLRNANLNDAGLSYADLCEAGLRNADLSRADLQGAKLRRADLGRADLHGAVLRKADLRRADLRRADLSRADLRGADLRSADLRAANLDDADLRTTPLRGAYLIAASLRYTKLGGANLSRCYMSDANLRGADLSEANLGNARLIGASLKKATLAAAFLAGADLRGADLRAAVLRGADLSRADLSNADLSQADLTGARLEGTKLNETTLRETTLREARFNQTILCADLSRAIGLAEVIHDAPSVLAIRSIVSCARELPHAFLQGCGLSDLDIDYFLERRPALPRQPACYVRYSASDREFTERLVARLQQEGVRCWASSQDAQTDVELASEQIVATDDVCLYVASDAALTDPALSIDVAGAIRAADQHKKKAPADPSLRVQVRSNGSALVGRKQPRRADRLVRLVVDARGWQNDATLVERVLPALLDAVRNGPPDAPRPESTD